MSSRSLAGKPRHHKLTKRILISVAAGLLLLAGIAVWLAFRAQVIRTEMAAASSLVPQFKNQVLSGDKPRAEETLQLLRRHANVSYSAATDPLWVAASAVPWVGSNFSAVTALTTSTVDLVDGAAEPLLEIVESLDIDTFTPTNGRFDVTSMIKVSPNLNEAADTLEATHSRLGSIDKAGLFPEVAEPLTRAIDALHESRYALSVAADTSKILPDMLGAKEPRNYLVLVQNNAEVRATGGLAGSLAVLRVENGSVRFVSQISGASMGRFTPPVAVNPKQTEIYSTRLGAFVGDVNLTPHFPTVAQSAKAMWESRNGDVIDGVIALDPVVLAHILEASGPVQLETRDQLDASDLPAELSSKNVVQTLLSDVYLRLPNNAVQDAYFAYASETIFNALVTNKVPGDKVLQALVKSTSENRIHVWSRHEKDQRVLAGTVIGGDTSSPASGGSAFGVYFNDGTGAKMDYYIKRTVQLLEVCTSNDYSEFKVKIRSTNTAPSDAARLLPMSITGDGRYGVPPGAVQTNLVVYGPAMSHVDTTVQDGLRVAFGSHLDGNRPVGVVTTRLAPGQTSEVEMTFVKVVQNDDPKVVVTPTIQDVKDVLQPSQRASCADH